MPQKPTSSLETGSVDANRRERDARKHRPPTLTLQRTWALKWDPDVSQLSSGTGRMPAYMAESELNVSATAFQLPSACLV